MPSLDGATGWLNSEPLDPAELRGHVVLVNFWTLTCINWLRQEPYVRAWSQAYRDDGLIVIGVHTPEFSFEHDIDLVRQAVEERGDRLPRSRSTTTTRSGAAFANHYWPALYFVDTDGIIRDQHFGEGRYEQSERVDPAAARRRARARRRRGGRCGGRGRLGPPGHARDLSRLRARERPRHRDARRPTRAYESPTLRSNHWALGGEWTIGPENVVARPGGGSIAFRFHARDAHLVLSPGAREPIPFRVLLDGEAPGPSHGVDVDEDGNGMLREGRMYQLVRQHDAVRERTLEITFLEPRAPRPTRSRS